MEEDALTRRLKACCYTVHRELGPGFPVETYRRALTRELEKAGLTFSREESRPVLYDGEEIDRIPIDFIVDKMVVEVASKPALDKFDAAQAASRVRISGLTRGLLVNLGSDEPQFKSLTAARPKI